MIDKSDDRLSWLDEAVWRVVAQMDGHLYGIHIVGSCKIHVRHRITKMINAGFLSPVENLLRGKP